MQRTMMQILIGVVLALAGTAQADEWGTNVDLALNGVAVDMSSIRKVGDTATFWTMVYRRNSKSASGKTIAHFMWKWQIDCIKEQSRLLSSTAYDSSGISVETEYYSSRAKAEDIVPESLGSDLEGVACSGPPKDWRDIKKGADVSVFLKTLVDMHAKSSKSVKK